MKKTPLVVAAIAAAVLVTASAAGARPAASHTTVDITIWHAQTDSAGKTIHKLAVQFNKTHPGIVVHDELGSNGDEMVQKLQAVIGSDELPRHRVRVRLGRAERVAVEQGRRHLEGRQGGRLQLEQPLPGGP